MALTNLKSTQVLNHRAESMRSLNTVARFWPMELDELARVAERFPFGMSRYWLNLIRFPDDPIWRQAVPDVRELEDLSGHVDPLAEESLSPVPNLVHRYSNRVLWLVSHRCAVHCRFCTRKRRWRRPLPMTEEYFQAGLDYIGRHSEVKDVLLSGGDPLLLQSSRLQSILKALRSIPHVEIIRIGTRVPCAFPRRVTPRLVGMLTRYHPIYMSLHFNHPWELTREAGRACSLLADGGIPLASQTVLLRGINDRPEILGELFQGLLAQRIRPYYLMQMDLTEGTAHFRTPISTGLKILKALRNRISGLAMPHFVIDLPGGQGKIPLVPNCVQELDDGRIVFRDYQGNLCEYPLLEGEHQELHRWMRP